MDEADFWVRLEYRVTAELAGMSQNELRFLWCDGFKPEEYLIDDPVPRVIGLAWICEGGSHQTQWPFTLLLGSRYRSRSDVDWASLLPPDNVTRWLGVDPRVEHVHIEPSAAVLDEEAG